MNEMALRRPSAGAWRQFLQVARRVFGAIADGFAAAKRYERLKTMSDAELARRGLKREDLAWFALFGERPPRQVNYGEGMDHLEEGDGPEPLHVGPRPGRA